MSEDSCLRLLNCRALLGYSLLRISQQGNVVTVEFAGELDCVCVCVFFLLWKMPTFPCFVTITDVFQLRVF